MEITIGVKRTSHLTHSHSKSLNTKLAYNAVCHECLNARDINVPNSPFRPALAFFLSGFHYPGLKAHALACGLIEVSPCFLSPEVVPALPHRPVGAAPPPHWVPAILDGRFLLSGLTLSFHLECHPPSLSDAGSPLMSHFLPRYCPPVRPSPLPLSG